MRIPVCVQLPVPLIMAAKMLTKLIFTYFIARNMLSHVVWCKLRYVSYVSGDFAQCY